MKKYLTSWILGLLMTSCCIADDIELNKNFIEVDYQAQTVIIKANADILSIRANRIDTDTEEYNIDSNEYYDIITGDWFSATLDITSPRQIAVVMQKNLTGHERRVKIYANRLVGQDVAIILQNPKPTE